MDIDDKICPEYELLNYIRDVILVINRDLKIAWTSPSVLRELGYDDGELPGSDIGSIFNRSGIEPFKKAFETLSSEGPSPPLTDLPFEVSVRSKDGSILWMEAMCSIADQPGGKGPVIVCSLRDTSLRKLIDDTMQENISLLQILIDSIPDAIFITDKNGLIEGVNRAFEDAVGRQGNVLTGKALAELNSMSGSDLASWINTIITGVDGSIKIPLDKVAFADGSLRDIVFNKIPYANAAGENQGFIGIIYDVTQRKQLEDSLRMETEGLKAAREELSKKNTELEEAYSELKDTQMQILQQEKMASIGQLAAGVAHEINNPMGFISSNLSSLSKYVDKIIEYINIQSTLISEHVEKVKCNDLEEKKKSLKIDFIKDDIKDLIRESQDGTERVKKIVQDLKSFSRNDQLDYREANINECMESTINIVWNELKYKATVHKELGSIPMVRCFPQQINQVFMNLLINAVHAIETTGDIRIKTWVDDGWVFALVSDNGHGMTPEVREKIFEPFFTTKEAGKGTGLGLSITYDIVKKHGGEISVESEPDKGTTFTVRLPVAGVSLDE
jgi:PAS domain S-box-containing protein